MASFRVLLAGLWLMLVIYTGVVIANHGLSLLPIFFGDIVRFVWPGQFNLDFLCLLILSAIWTAWRNGFSASGVILALVALFGGSGFLLIYILFLTGQSKGNWGLILLGPGRVNVR
ncbi:MAG: hypothetical protein JSS43_18035 [Proteobacteria bacterium]|nr:hypothetical protein [Pseudomonadota bacterium]